MKRIFSISILALSIFSILISSCKKNNDNKTTSMGTVYIHLHTDIDTNEVDDKTQLYSDGNGRQFSLSTAQLYISNFKLNSANGTVVSIANAHILKSIDSEQYLVGNAPIGSYTSVTFDVGLDDATNALSPTAFSTTGYVPNTTMWYGNTTQGYMFMKLQGMADTTATKTGTNLVPFSYEIGSAANRKTITTGSRGTGAFSSYPVYTLLKDGVIYVHMVCDYGKLLSVVNFKTQDSTDSYTNHPSLATTIANNIPNMFRYEE
ncbi:MAG: hypothetical protein JSS96_17020 [Bacteroidetes bacterium]|nr:hypothetical protein [Bacteroidota bacterium]